MSEAGNAPGTGKFPFTAVTEDGVILDVYLQPNAKRSQIAGIFDNRLKIQVISPPIDGKANRELCRFIAAALATKPSNIRILSGKKSRLKRLLIRNTSSALIDKIITSHYNTNSSRKCTRLESK